MENFIVDPSFEKPLGINLIEQVVCMAKKQTDMMVTQDNACVQLEEVQLLQLPFLFPQDGYLIG